VIVLEKVEFALVGFAIDKIDFGQRIERKNLNCQWWFVSQVENLLE